MPFIPTTYATTPNAINNQRIRGRRVGTQITIMAGAERFSRTPYYDPIVLR
jgi:hypothetical protein